MEGLELCRAALIIAAILRAVGEKRAIRPHRTGHQQRTGLRVLGEVRLARFARQLDAFADQRPGLRVIQPACGKTRRSGLIAGGDRHLRPGAKVVEMHIADQLRVLQQHFRRPQAVSQIAAAGLQLGGHGAVQQHERLGGKQGGKRISLRHVGAPESFSVNE